MSRLTKNSPLNEKSNFIFFRGPFVSTTKGQREIIVNTHFSEIKFYRAIRKICKQVKLCEKKKICFDR